MVTDTITLFGREDVKVYKNRVETIDDFLQRQVNMRPDQPAIVTEQESLTYQELNDQAEKIAAYFQVNHGIQLGDRIAVMIGNKHQFPLMVYACAKLGAIMVPVNIKLSVEEKAYILGHSAVKAVVLEQIFENELKEILQTQPEILPDHNDYYITDGENTFHNLTDHNLPFSPVKVEETDGAYILYTSGTTGRPKGAVLTHINVVHSVMNYQYVFETDVHLKTLIAVPMFHVTGLVGQLHHLIYIGGTVYSMERYQNKKYIEYILKEQINFLFNVPTIFIMMATEQSFKENSFDFVEKVAFGGSPIYEQTFRMLQDAFPNANLHNAYGATETTSPATLMPVNYRKEKVRSVGPAVPVADIKIAKDNGKRAQIMESGEILIKGPMVIKEYWRNEEANANNFVNGYWKSGDIGIVDEDGFVYVKDRKKDMISRGGEKIFSIEVEDVLKGHEDVHEAAVVGLPDPVFGEKVKAFVVAPHIAGEEATLKTYCATHLAKYKIPEVIEFVDELPRNASGKILKNQLKQVGGN
ncbi:class I adenylate-forming enzyme family protein [Halalkalibacillus halophilus]|uniref:class I adenylate-forming enzyme family protein n=1 Tax=Halalkalibacillus halophilus TaxID=392827 RepID=UPI000414F650|nr:class I adenylate-forming enzyme family protein [Halalkalibacillus halophilus]